MSVAYAPLIAKRSGLIVKPTPKISQLRQMLEDLSAENASYKKNTINLVDSTEEVGKANEALEKGIADARKLLEELQKQLAALNPVLAKSLRRRRLARRRLIKYRTHFTKGRRRKQPMNDVDKNQIAGEVEKYDGLLHGLTDDVGGLKDKKDQDEGRLQQLKKLSGLRGDLSQMNEMLRNDADYYLDMVDFGKLKLDDELKKDFNELQKKMKRGEKLKRALDALSDSSDELSESFLDDLEERLQKADPLVDELDRELGLAPNASNNNNTTMSALTTGRLSELLSDKLLDLSSVSVSASQPEDEDMSLSARVSILKDKVDKVERKVLIPALGEKTVFGPGLRRGTPLGSRIGTPRGVFRLISREASKNELRDSSLSFSAAGISNHEAMPPLKDSALVASEADAKSGDAKKGKSGSEAPKKKAGGAKARGVPGDNSDAKSAGSKGSKAKSGPGSKSGHGGKPKGAYGDKDGSDSGSMSDDDFGPKASESKSGKPSDAGVGPGAAVAGKKGDSHSDKGRSDDESKSDDSAGPGGKRRRRRRSAAGSSSHPGGKSRSGDEAKSDDEASVGQDGKRRRKSRSRSGSDANPDSHSDKEKSQSRSGSGEEDADGRKGHRGPGGVGPSDGGPDAAGKVHSGRPGDSSKKSGPGSDASDPEGKKRGKGHDGEGSGSSDQEGPDGKKRVKGHGASDNDASAPDGAGVKGRGGDGIGPNEDSDVVGPDGQKRRRGHDGEGSDSADADGDYSVGPDGQKHRKGKGPRGTGAGEEGGEGGSGSDVDGPEHGGKKKGDKSGHGSSSAPGTDGSRSASRKGGSRGDSGSDGDNGPGSKKRDGDDGSHHDGKSGSGQEDDEGPEGKRRRKRGPNGTGSSAEIADRDGPHGSAKGTGSGSDEEGPDGKKKRRGGADGSDARGSELGSESDVVIGPDGKRRRKGHDGEGSGSSGEEGPDGKKRGKGRDGEGSGSSGEEGPDGKRSRKGHGGEGSGSSDEEGPDGKKRGKGRDGEGSGSSGEQGPDGRKRGKGRDGDGSGSSGEEGPDGKRRRKGHDGEGSGSSGEEGPDGKKARGGHDGAGSGSSGAEGDYSIGPDGQKRRRRGGPYKTGSGEGDSDGHGSRSGGPDGRKGAKSHGGSEGGDSEGGVHHGQGTHGSDTDGLGSAGKASGLKDRVGSSGPGDRQPGSGNEVGSDDEVSGPEGKKHHKRRGGMGSSAPATKDGDSRSGDESTGPDGKKKRRGGADGSDARGSELGSESDVVIGPDGKRRRKGRDGEGSGSSDEEGPDGKKRGKGRDGEGSGSGGEEGPDGKKKRRGGADGSDARGSELGSENDVVIGPDGKRRRKGHDGEGSGSSGEEGPDGKKRGKGHDGEGSGSSGEEGPDGKRRRGKGHGGEGSGSSGEEGPDGKKRGKGRDGDGSGSSGEEGPDGKRRRKGHGGEGSGSSDEEGPDGKKRSKDGATRGSDAGDRSDDAEGDVVGPDGKKRRKRRTHGKGSRRGSHPDGGDESSQAGAKGHGHHAGEESMSGTLPEEWQSGDSENANARDQSNPAGERASRHKSGRRGRDMQGLSEEPIEDMSSSTASGAGAGRKRKVRFPSDADPNAKGTESEVVDLTEGSSTAEYTIPKRKEMTKEEEDSEQQSVMGLQAFLAGQPTTPEERAKMKKRKQSGADDAVKIESDGEMITFSGQMRKVKVGSDEDESNAKDREEIEGMMDRLRGEGRSPGVSDDLASDALENRKGARKHRKGSGDDAQVMPVQGVCRHRRPNARRKSSGGGEANEGSKPSHGSGGQKEGKDGQRTPKGKLAGITLTEAKKGSPGVSETKSEENIIKDRKSPPPSPPVAKSKEWLLEKFGIGPFARRGLTDDKNVYPTEATRNLFISRESGDEPADEFAETAGDRKTVSETKWAYSLLQSAIARQLDRTRLQVAIAEAQFMLSQINDEITTLEDDILLAKFEQRGIIKKTDLALRIMSLYIPPSMSNSITGKRNTIAIQTLMKKVDLEEMKTSIDDNNDFLSKQIENQQEKMIADTHLPLLEKALQEHRRKNDKLSIQLEKVERRLGIVSPTETKVTSKETRQRMRYERAMNEDLEKAVELDERIKNQYKSIDDLKKRIDDQRDLHKQLKAQIDEQRKAPVPNVRQLHEQLQGYKSATNKNTERSTMLQILVDSYDRRISEINNISKEAADMEMTVVSMKSRVDSMKGMVKEDGKPMTSLSDISELEHTCADLNLDYERLKTKQRGLVNQIKGYVAELIQYKLPVPENKCLDIKHEPVVEDNDDDMDDNNYSDQ